MSLAFPLRMQQNGLLERQDASAAVISLLQVMARTPAGSWQGCKSFGLRDLFEHSRQRMDVGKMAMQRINDVFQDLALDSFSVSSVAREFSAAMGVDTYAITIEQRDGRGGGFITLVSHEE